jgi:hypothetical protein
MNFGLGDKERLRERSHMLPNLYLAPVPWISTT